MTPHRPAFTNQEESPTTHKHSDRLPRPEAGLVRNSPTTGVDVCGVLPAKSVPYLVNCSRSLRTVELLLTSDTGTLDGAELSGSALTLSEAIGARRC